VQVKKVSGKKLSLEGRKIRRHAVWLTSRLVACFDKKMQLEGKETFDDLC
jgi:hypothetical protein